MVAAPETEEEEESETMLQRTASSLAGVRRAPTREDLLAEGVHPDQVDHQLTQQHLEEIMRTRFMFAFMASGCLMCVMLIFMFFGFIMVFAAYMETPDTECDVPLRLWFKVLCGNILFNMWCNQTSPRTGGSLGQRIFCCYTPPEGGEVGGHPLRVRIYVVLNSLTQITWCGVGLYWVTISGSGPSGPDAPPVCYVAEPHLYKAIKFYAVINLIFWFLMGIVGIGFVTIFRTMLLRGVLGGLRPAPAGSLERNTKVVPQGDARLRATPSCPVCMEEWEADPERVILQTNTCGHCFHKDCLQHWLGINRTCPLCRDDLGVGDPEEQV